MKLLNLLLIVSIASSWVCTKVKFFVVERESESLATIFNGVKRTNIPGMHNMNHGVVKFDGKDGYVISRDGFVVKFNPDSEKILAEYKTSKSAIGFVIGAIYVAVANYDDKSVDILDRDLKPLEKIQTGSKNVGIKTYENYLIFSQMDNDTISVFKDMNGGKNKPNFKLFKEFKTVQLTLKTVTAEQ